MLTRDDYLDSDAGTFHHLDLPYLYNIFFKDGAATITNTSAELVPKCLIECTKQVWATKSDITDGFGGNRVIVNSRVVIAMIRSKNDEGARKTAYNLYNEFLPHGYEYGKTEYNLVNAPAGNSRIISKIIYDRQAIILTTSIGPITIWVVNFPYQLSDDAVYEVEVADYFANLQIRKLEKAGMAP